MIIGGLQKLSLIDYPKNIACTIFLIGCNFRCGFCHNPELVLNTNKSPTYSEEEFLDFLEKRRKYIDAVCVTGGEPLINNDLPEFLKKIKAKGYFIKIDTNGSYPELLKKLISDNLVDYIAMDIKSAKDSYSEVSGVNVDLNKIEESIRVIMNSKLDYEFRTTVIKTKHNPEILKSIAVWLNRLGKPKKFFIQNFIPRQGKLLDKSFENLPQFKEEELEQMKKVVKSYFDEVEVRN
jgi:pyruvate formate lyase activating enzyme